MSDQWLYRILGQEFGPVSLELVRSLVVSGIIAPDDEVRDTTRSNWILACAASELRDSIKESEINLAVERRSSRDEWYCRGATGDVGPLKMIDLIQLAADGELSPDEEVKSRLDDYWKQLSSIQRLIELLPFRDEIYARALQTKAKLQASDAKQRASYIPSNFAQRFSKVPNQAEVFENTDQVDSTVIPFPGLRTNSTTDNMPAQSSSSSRRTPDETGTGSSNHSRPEEAGQAHFPGPISMSSIHDYVSRTFSRGKNEPDPGRERLPGSEHAQQSREKMNNREIPASVLPGSRSQGIGSVLNGFETISTFGQIESSENPDQTDLESNEPDEWMGWVGGEEFGPIGYSELLTWAVIGRLSPMDFVRRGGEGQYVPAVNIPCLFTIRAAADSLSRRVIPIPQASPAPNSESEVTIEPCPGSALMETTTITDWTFDFKK